MNWGRSTGTGRVPTRRWARPGSGGKKVGKNPTDRGKRGTQKSVLTDAQGGPLAAVVEAANVNDHLLLEATREAIVVARPAPTAARPQHLCLDGGSNNEPSREVAARHRYTPHIRPGGKEPAAAPGAVRHPPRRWVVERTLARLSKCRALLVRYDKHWQNDLGLIQLACGQLWYRRLHRLHAT
jgi:putative transposase